MSLPALPRGDSRRESCQKSPSRVNGRSIRPGDIPQSPRSANLNSETALWESETLLDLSARQLAEVPEQVGQRRHELAPVALVQSPPTRTGGKCPSTRSGESSSRQRGGERLTPTHTPPRPLSLRFPGFGARCESVSAVSRSRHSLPRSFPRVAREATGTSAPNLHCTRLRRGRERSRMVSGRDRRGGPGMTPGGTKGGGSRRVPTRLVVLGPSTRAVGAVLTRRSYAVEWFCTLFHAPGLRSWS